jgi:hypothetical protein
MRKYTSESVQLTKIDCMENRELCFRFQIRSFPTLRLVAPARPNEGMDGPRTIFPFNGQRTFHGLLQFVRNFRQLAPPLPYPLPLPGHAHVEQQAQHAQQVQQQQLQQQSVQHAKHQQQQAKDGAEQTQRNEHGAGGLRSALSLAAVGGLGAAGLAPESEAERVAAETHLDRESAHSSFLLLVLMLGFLVALVALFLNVSNKAHTKRAGDADKMI